MDFEISIPSDSDGYTSLQCQYCGEYFKIRNDEFRNQDHNNIYCPVCGLTNSINKFYTKDVYDKAIEISKKEMYKLINKAFSGLKSSKNFKVTTNNLECTENKILIDKDYSMKISVIKCCDIHVKVRKIDAFIGLYCPYCGRDNIE